jgi:hypothetical protein
MHHEKEEPHGRVPIHAHLDMYGQQKIINPLPKHRMLCCRLAAHGYSEICNYRKNDCNIKR